MFWNICDFGVLLRLAFLLLHCVTAFIVTNCHAIKRNVSMAVPFRVRKCFWQFLEIVVCLRSCEVTCWGYHFIFICICCFKLV
jgi:hypothetical protein